MRKLTALPLAAATYLTQVSGAFAAGTTPAKVATPSASTASSTLPNTGVFEPTVLVFVAAVGLLFVGAYYVNRALSK